MPPLGMSYDQRDWVEGAIDALAGFFQGVQTRKGSAASSSGTPIT